MRFDAGRAAPDPAGLDEAVRAYARRGVRLQLVVRAVLVVFVGLTMTVVPPTRGAAAGYALVVAYALWAVGIAVWIGRGGRAAERVAWLALFVDLAVLAALTLATGLDAQQSWTADVLINGFFLVPVLAATDLRPRVCAAVVVPTVLVSLAASVATRSANEEPWASIALHTLVLAGVGVACVGLSRIQRSRLAAISELLRERTALLDELVRTEQRERRALSEHLHDGALQYVLAARQDLDELHDPDPAPDAVERLEHALAESSRLLRSTVSELHPAVLHQAGLARALRDLAAATRGVAVEVTLRDWPADLRTSQDTLLFSAARELLGNVTRHAGAGAARVELVRDGATARLAVADDGRGIADGALAESLRDGHIGLRSHQLRAAAAGGHLTLARRDPHGTVATLELPLPG
ncbi:MAG: sensor histidine kinase [Pseudonocardia sp.]